MTKPLTTAACAKYRSGSKRHIVRDGDARSLYLVISPAGFKSWMMRFRRPDGRPGKLVLGPFDSSGRELKDEPQVGQPLTLAAARQLATKVHRLRALGEDVIADHKARKRRQRTEAEERSANTFASAAQTYVEQHAKQKQRRWYEVARLLGLNPDVDLTIRPRGLAQRWGARAIASIDGHDVWSVIEEARRVAVPGTPARNPGQSDIRSRALFAALSSMFSWAQHRRLVEVNPCAGVHRPPAAKARERTLTPDEVRWFWLASDSAGEPFGSIFKLLILLGQRLNEVAGMRLAELSGDNNTWNLPSSRTKNKRPHMVPLPPAAQVIIERALKERQIIFSTTGRTPPSGWSRAKRRLDAAMLAAARKERGDAAIILPWRLHDLRRTVVTGMAELGMRPDVIELVVNHVSGARGGIAGVYNRSELLDERRAALQRWATHISGIVNGAPSNVSRLRPWGTV